MPPVTVAARAWVARLAANAAVRTFLQGAVVTAAVAGFSAARSVVNGGTGAPDWRTVGSVAGQAMAMAVLAYAARRATGQQVIVPEVQLDALIRAGRTLLAGFVYTVGAATVEATQAGMGSGPVNWTDLARHAAVAAGMAAAAWAHRMILDPSQLPTAKPPPLPPGTR